MLKNVWFLHQNKTFNSVMFRVENNIIFSCSFVKIIHEYDMSVGGVKTKILN